MYFLLFLDYGCGILALFDELEDFDARPFAELLHVGIPAGARRYECGRLQDDILEANETPLQYRGVLISKLFQEEGGGSTISFCIARENLLCMAIRKTFLEPSTGPLIESCEYLRLISCYS